MTLAAYTQAIIEDMDRFAECTLDFGDGLTVDRARSRLMNAARRAGFVITTRIERDSMAGFGPATGAVIATVVGWDPWLVRPGA